MTLKIVEIDPDEERRKEHKEVINFIKNEVSDAEDKQHGWLTGFFGITIRNLDGRAIVSRFRIGTSEANKIHMLGALELAKVDLAQMIIDEESE